MLSKVNWEGGQGRKENGGGTRTVPFPLGTGRGPAGEGRGDSAHLPATFTPCWLSKSGCLRVQETRKDLSLDGVSGAAVPGLPVP